MYCKYCGKEIDEDAKFCSGCGRSMSGSDYAIAEEPQKKKKKKRHPIMGAILIILGLFIFVGVFGGNTDPKKVNNSTIAEKTVEVTTAPTLYTVGDTLEMGYIRVTFTNVAESEGSQFTKPTDGNVFVICEFTIENNTDAEMAVSSMMSFECYFDDYAANLSIGAMVADQSKQQLDGSVAPGKKISGVVGYEAPKDWKEMEVHFKSNIYSYKPFVFNYSK